MPRVPSRLRLNELSPRKGALSFKSGYAAFCIRRKSNFVDSGLSSSVRAYVPPAVLGRSEVWEENSSNRSEVKPPIPLCTPCCCCCCCGGGGVCRFGPRSGTMAAFVRLILGCTRFDGPYAYVGLRASKRPGVDLPPGRVAVAAANWGEIVVLSYQ